MTSHDQAADEEPVTQLAAEAIARLAEGEAVDLQDLAGQLPDVATRQRFLELVDDGQGVQKLLPRVLRPGALLNGRYRLVREIGSGGMGRVFEADDLQLARRVAIKVLTSQGAQSFDPGKQFLNEALLLAGLQHPNIVAVHELGTHLDQPYLVMDLVEGTPLDEVLERARVALVEAAQRHPRDGELLLASVGRALPAGRRGPPPDEDWFHAAARVVLEVARTLEVAHAKDIVHRDIKPHNVLLRGDGTPVILDFGLAGTLDHAGGGLTRGLFGTVAYLAPEQIQSGRIGADKRSDVYQLGLLLYEVLTLQRSFAGDEISSLLSRIGRGEFLRPRGVDRGVPAEIEAVCLKAMELEPARRYATVRELREDLERWVEDGAPPLAARGGSVASGLRLARYAARRNRMAVAVTGTALAATLAFVLLSPEAPATTDFQPFRYRQPGNVKLYPDFVDVAPDDVLGGMLRSDEPLYVYALSVFGREGPREYVAPMKSRLLLPEGETRPPDDDGTWGVLVKPGQSLECTKVSSDAPDGQHEGLLVLASATPRPEIETWMDSLNIEASLSHMSAVPYEAARRAFGRRGGETRGETPEPSPEREAAILDALSAASVLGEAEWPFEAGGRWEFSFPVRR